MKEEAGPVSRGFKRYDPYTRNYVKWAVPQDWWATGTHGRGLGINGDGLPRFTRDEEMRMNKLLARGRRINPGEMGDEWTDFGPKVRISLATVCQLLTVYSDSERNMTISGEMPTEEPRICGSAEDLKKKSTSL